MHLHRAVLLLFYFVCAYVCVLGESPVCNTLCAETQPNQRYALVSMQQYKYCVKMKRVTLHVTCQLRETIDTPACCCHWLSHSPKSATASNSIYTHKSFLNIEKKVNDRIMWCYKILIWLMVRCTQFKYYRIYHGFPFPWFWTFFQIGIWFNRMVPISRKCDSYHWYSFMNLLQVYWM